MADIKTLTEDYTGIPSILSRKTQWIIFLLSLLVQILIIVLFAYNYLFMVIGVIGLLTLLIYTAFSVEKIFLLLAFFVSCFEIYGYLSYFPGITLWYDYKIAYPLFFLLIVYWIIHLVTNKEKFLFNEMDAAVAIMLSVMLLGIVHGLLQGYNIKLIFSDSISQPYYIMYFVFLYSPLREKIRKYYDYLLIFAVIVALQYIYAVVQFKTAYFLKRVVSSHWPLAQFAVPYVISTITYSHSRRRKILFSFALPIALLGVVLSQQRSLYLSIALTVVVLFFIFLYTRREWIKNNLGKVFIIAAAFIGVVIACLVILQAIFGGKFLNTLSVRLLIFLNPNLLGKETSWFIRWHEIQSAFQNFSHFWLFGKGFGISQVTRFRYEVQVVLDNAYVYWIWKTGIIGLLSALYMYFVFFKRCFMTLRKNVSRNERILLVAALLNTAGMMFNSFANVSIAFFRHIYIWMPLFACVEVIARKHDKIH